MRVFNVVKKHKFTTMVVVLILLGFISITLGKYPISFSDFKKIILEKLFLIEYGLNPVMEKVVLEIRLPRIMAAILIGGSLSVAGASYQGIFNNPLVSPDILGATAGAALGAAVGIICSWGIIGIQFSSFIFSIFAVGITYYVSSKVRQNNQVLVLVLTGILVGTVFNSLVSLIKYLADPYNKLPTINFWLIGSLTGVDLKDVAVLLIISLISLFPLYMMRWKLNVLSFGDEEAQTLGIETKKTRFGIIVFSTLLTASSVAICGVIGWVGLVVPHLARNIVGPNYKILLPASFFMGASFLLIVDTMARTLFFIEIPLGIITSLIGAPFYIWLLARSRRGWK
ncbi:MAG: FecCD family ABC transporter permease [Sedimentibacter sp.]